MAAGAQTWLGDVNRLIDDGEFARAEQVLSALPQQEKDNYKIRIDSLRKIMQRTRGDFSINPAVGKQRIEQLVGREVSPAEIERWKLDKYIEYRIIDSQEWWFRRGIGNFRLLNRELYAEANEKSRHDDYATTEKHYHEAMLTKADRNGTRNWHHTDITMTIEVDADAVPAGETLRVWMPMPFENLRQRNVQLVQSSHPATLSQGSVHHTAYMEAKAEAGKKTTFSIRYSYDVGERNIP